MVSEFNDICKITKAQDIISGLCFSSFKKHREAVVKVETNHFYYIRHQVKHRNNNPKHKY